MDPQRTDTAQDQEPATAPFWRAVEASVEWAEHGGVLVEQPPLDPPDPQFRTAA